MSESTPAPEPVPEGEQEPVACQAGGSYDPESETYIAWVRIPNPDSDDLQSPPLASVTLTFSEDVLGEHVLGLVNAFLQTFDGIIEEIDQQRAADES